jgi:hypothetical protein
MRPELALAAIAAVTLLLPDTHAQAGPPPWNRRLDTLGIVPTPGKPGSFDISAVWTVELGGPTSMLLPLGTDIALEIDGVEVERTTAFVEVSPLSGNCGSCAPGCGNGAVNGMAMAMLCLESGPGSCACQFPPLTGNFHSQELKPGVEVIVILYPAPGALPEFDTGDDSLKKTFKGPLLWDRQIVKAEAKPSPTGPEGTFDVHVDWTLGSVGILEPMLVSPQFGVFVDGYEKYVYVGPCGPWILAPSDGCQPCTGATCATITCNGQVVSTSICEESPDGVYCGCFSSDLFHDVIPGVKLALGQKLSIQMEPLPGALPELPTLAMTDTFEVPSPFGTWEDLGHALKGTHGAPLQVGEGSLMGGDPVSITLTGALENAPAWLVAGADLLEKPFKGGVLVPDPTPPAALLGLLTGPFGKVKLDGAWPAGLPGGFTLYLQWWIEDAQGPAGFAASNALSATTP